MEKFNLKYELKGVDSQWHEYMDLSGLKEKEIYYSSPSKGQVFNAFKLFEPSETKILILGQDPYPSKNNNEGRAHGLAFSFGPNSKKKEADDSLLNIFRAIKAYKDEHFEFNRVSIEQIIGDKDKKIKPWGTNLEEWAKNNRVLLLNTALTYKENEKHFNIWSSFITQIICNLIKYNSKKSDKLVVFLWGDDARKLFNDCTTTLLKTDRNCIKKQILALISNHPSPISINNYGNFPILAPTHFKACDEFLGTDIWKNFPENNQKNT